MTRKEILEWIDAAIETLNELEIDLECLAPNVEELDEEERFELRAEAIIELDELLDNMDEYRKFVRGWPEDVYVLRLDDTPLPANKFTVAVLLDDMRHEEEMTEILRQSRSSRELYDYTYMEVPDTLDKAQQLYPDNSCAVWHHIINPGSAIVLAFNTSEEAMMWKLKHQN